MENYLMINGKRIELTEEQVKVLTDEKEKKDIWKPKREETYYSILTSGGIGSFGWYDTIRNQISFNIANCCTDKTIMKKRALQETLNRLLWRFSMQNGRNINHCKDVLIPNWSIFYDFFKNAFKVTNYYGGEIYNSINFVSKEVAQRAIDEIINPFVKEHPEIVE